MALALCMVDVTLCGVFPSPFDAADHVVACGDGQYLAVLETHLFATKLLGNLSVYSVSERVMDEFKPLALPSAMLFDAVIAAPANPSAFLLQRQNVVFTFVPHDGVVAQQCVLDTPRSGDVVAAVHTPEAHALVHCARAASVAQLCSPYALFDAMTGARVCELPLQHMSSMPSACQASADTFVVSHVVSTGLPCVSVFSTVGVPLYAHAMPVLPTRTFVLLPKQDVLFIDMWAYALQPTGLRRVGQVPLALDGVRVATEQRVRFVIGDRVFCSSRNNTTGGEALMELHVERARCVACTAHATHRGSHKQFWCAEHACSAHAEAALSLDAWCDAEEARQHDAMRSARERFQRDTAAAHAQFEAEVRAAYFTVAAVRRSA